MPLLVIVPQWDDHAKVWYVADSNIPGLNAEAPTYDELMSRCRELAPVCLEYNAAAARGSVH